MQKQELLQTINNLEENLDNANSRFENRDNLINDLQEENVILLENSSELRSKIEDLEYMVFDMFDYHYFNFDTSMSRNAHAYYTWGDF